MRSVLKPGALLGGLTTLVLALLLLMVLGPYPFVAVAGVEWPPRYVQDSPPPSDLPPRAGYRTVWQGRHQVRPGDVVLEVVEAAPTPFFPHHSDPLLAAAFMARRARAAVLVTLGVNSPRAGLGPFQYLGGADARIDEVIYDRGYGAPAPGSSIFVASHRGTRVTFEGDTQIVHRVDYVRVPRVNGRYLLFLGLGDHWTLRPAAFFGYGNGFEIRGRRLVHMSLPHAGDWGRAASVSRVLAVVRRRGAMPPVGPGEFETREELLR